MKKLKDDERAEIREILKICFALLGMSVFFAILFFIALAFYLGAFIQISCPLLSEGHCALTIDL